MFAKKSKFQELVDAAAPHVDTARDRLVNDVLPAVQTAVENARDQAAVAAASAADTAREQAGPAAAEAKRRSLAATAALKGEEPAKKSGGLRKVLLLAGLAGAVAFVANKLKSGQEQQAWQSSYAPKPPAPAAATTTDDVGGATPGEALSDATDNPHPVSSPDEPVEVSEIDAQPDTNRL